jgi:hypothetical protein
MSADTFFALCRSYPVEDGRARVYYKGSRTAPGSHRTPDGEEPPPVFPEDTEHVGQAWRFASAEEALDYREREGLAGHYPEVWKATRKRGAQP